MGQAIKVAMTMQTALAVAFAFPQDTPPPPQDPKPSVEQEEKSPLTIRPWQLTYDLGYANWDLRGNRHKFRQYATPPDGLYLRSLSYEHWINEGLHGLQVDLLAPGEEDYRVRASVSLSNGATRLAGSSDRARFFDTTPVVIEGSQRQSSEAYIRQSLTPDLALTLRSYLDQQDQNFDPPKGSLHQRTNTWLASAAGNLGGGFVDLSFSGTRFYDRTNVLPDSETRRWGLSYARSLTPGLNLEGGFVRSSTDLNGLTNDVNSWSFSGDWQAGEDTDLVFNFRHESLDLPSTQNAFVRERSMARARLIHRWPRWTGQIGYKRMDIERVRADHSFVDTPTLHSFDARINGRISPSVRVTGRFGRESLDGAAQMFTIDPRALYWDDRTFAQLKIDVGTERFTGYAVYSYREQKNDVRETQVRNYGLTVGGSLLVQPYLEVYFEGTTDIWSGRTRDAQNPNLDAFFGDGSVLVLGANWTLSPRAYATGSFTQYLVANDNPLLDRDTNVRGSFLTTGIHYQFPSGCELGLTLAPWRYTDRAYSQMGYDSFFLALIARGKF